MPEFTPAETYKLRADGYYSQGDTALGDAAKHTTAAALGTRVLPVRILPY